MRKIRFGSVGDLRLKVRSNAQGGDTELTDDVNLVEAIKSVKSKIGVVDSNLNSVSDPSLIESYVYELKSLHVKYDYLIVECKKRGLTAEFY